MAHAIIGIVGVAGSGKKIVWEHLASHHGFARVAFSAPAKRMLQAGFGLTPDQIEGENREKADPVLCWRNPRHLTRTLINDWGRKQIGHGVWCNLWRRDALALDCNVFADDVRYPDEAAVIRELGGEIWKVYRPGLAASDQSSEGHQRGITEDRLLANATSIPDLLKSVDMLVEQLMEKKDA